MKFFLVFKRYIHKHGKKLGPYYYQNVRSHDGKVKTIYVGANPRHHQRHRIRKPLLFLILALLFVLILGGSLFLLQNKAYLTKKAEAQPDFDVDQILIKVLIRSGEFIEKQIRIMNTGESPSEISIEALGLHDLLKIDSSSFTIKPGQTKIVSLNFSSFLPEQKIEQQPGIYIGKLAVKSQKAAKEIPIVVEIETKNVLFDMNLNPVAIERRVKQGSDTTIEVRLFNLESIESVNVDVGYFVRDMNGNTIVTESETVVVKTQASFFKTISIPKNLKPGPYVFAAQTKFGNSIGTASYLFDVVGPEPEPSFAQFCKNSILCLGLSLTTILLLFALTAYFYFFIGAYLYEKITGFAALPAKEKEKAEAVQEKAIAEPKEGIFGGIRNKLRKWKQGREREKQKKQQKADEERRAQLEAKKRELEEEEKIEKIRQEGQRKKDELKAKQRSNLKNKAKGFLHWIGLYRTPQEKRKIALQKEREKEKKKEAIQAIKTSGSLKKLYRILESSNDAINKNDAPKVSELYAKAKELYNDLGEQEKKEVYDKLMEFYIRGNQFIKEKEHLEEVKGREGLKRIKELESRKKQIEEERTKQEDIRKQRAYGKKLSKERKENLKEFFHRIGFYKTPEEKKQLALQKEREKQEGLQKEKESRKQEKQQKAEEERRAQLEAKKRELEEEKIEKIRQEEQRKKNDLKAKQREDRKKKIKEFLHGISFYKTPEEKKQLALQKEREKQEKLRKNEELKRLKEIESKRIEEERQREKQRRQIAKERIRQEDLRKKEQELRKKEETRKQKEIEAKHRENEKRGIEEENERKKEQERKQMESEAQRQEQSKAQKIEFIKQIEDKLKKNNETAEKLHLELSKLEGEKKRLSGLWEHADSRAEKIQREILDKSKEIKKLDLQNDYSSKTYKKHLSDLNERQKNEKHIIDSKIKELKAKLSEKQAALISGLEHELHQLSPEKRKSLEKWKRLELKAKIKIEEDSLWDELKKHKGKFISEKNNLEEDYKKSIEESNKKKNGIEQKIIGLEGQKQQILLDKNNSPGYLENKNKEIQKIRQKLDLLSKEESRLSAELSAHKSEFQKLWGFFSNLGPIYKNTIQKAIRRMKEQRLRFSAEKRKIEEKLRKQREREEESRRKEEERRRKEEEKRIREEQKKAGHEEKLRLREVAKRQRELEKERREEEREENRKNRDEERKREKEAKEQKEGAKFTEKSKGLETFQRALNSAKEAFDRKEIPAAKRFYVEARNLYIGLDYNEKKEVYDELMEMYNGLVRLK